MPVYQVPQFLDSGDKILGPLNPRQFIYSLAGLFINYFAFTLIQRAIPGLGFFGFLPLLPTIFLFGYLALGKYNGRDAEVYVLKFILYIKKPRKMSYQRMPYSEDLKAKLAKYSPEMINKRFELAANQKRSQLKNKYSDFDSIDSLSKAQQIRMLGKSIDYQSGNTAEMLSKAELQKMKKDVQINKKHKKFTEKDVSGVDDLVSQGRNEVNFFNVKKH